VREARVGKRRVANPRSRALRAESVAWLGCARGAAGGHDARPGKKMKKMRFLLLVAGATLAWQACAADLRPAGVFVEGGEGDHAMHAASLGVVWPWSWQHATASGAWSGYTEAYLSRWRARETDGHADFDHLGVVPMLRFRGRHGASPWFVEGGIGLIYMDRLFTTPKKQFTTRLNFADTLGVGRNFGTRGQHEVTLRFTHFSNAGLKRPNPGQNLLRVKYAYLF
jgi:lipid A 3-O-deacylase